MKLTIFCKDLFLKTISWNLCDAFTEHYGGLLHPLNLCPQCKTCFHLKHFGQQIKQKQLFLAAVSTLGQPVEQLIELHALDRYHNSNFQRRKHKKCMGVISQASISLPHYLLTYMGVFGFGQKTPPSLDGFSDSCIDGVP